MKLSKEVRIGILAVVAIAILYFGFKFLKGLDVFSNLNEYSIVFDDVQGLQTSNTVTYNGVNVGRVTEIVPDQKSNTVEVVISVNRKIQLNDNSEAILADDGLIGGKLIKLKINTGNEISDGGRLKSGNEVGLAELAMSRVTPTIQKFDSLMLVLINVIGQFDQTGFAVRDMVASANNLTRNVNVLVGSNSQAIGSVTANAATLTKQLSSLTQDLDNQLKPILSNTALFTDSLKSLQLSRTVNELNSTIGNLNTIVKKINEGKGSMGQLVNNQELYNNLSSTTATLNTLLKDLNNNPKKYVHFSVFGRKDKDGNTQIEVNN